MASVVVRSQKGFPVTAVIAKISDDKIVLRYCTAGDTPGEKIAPELKGMKVHAAPEATFTFEALRKRADWSDYALWVFPATSDFTVGEPLNVFAESVERKDPGVWFRSTQVTAAFRLFVPFANATTKEMGFAGVVGPEGKLVSNLGVTPTKEITFESVRKAVLPRIKISGSKSIEPNGVTELSIDVINEKGAVIPRDMTCYLECTAGYLAKQRVELKGGQGKVKFQALLLGSGDQARIKAGFKFVSGLEEHQIRIS